MARQWLIVTAGVERGRASERARKQGKRKLTVGGKEKCRKDIEAWMVEEKTGECRLLAKPR